jgi:hypothetical protein
MSDDFYTEELPVGWRPLCFIYYSADARPCKECPFRIECIGITRYANDRGIQ